MYAYRNTVWRMLGNIVKIAKLLNDLVIARTVYDLLKLGYNPTTLYRDLRWLVDHGFVRVVEHGGVKHYHLTGLGAELLKVLRRAVIHRITKILDEKGVGYRVWWGDEKVRATKPIIYVDRDADVPLDVKELVEIRVSREESLKRE